MGDDVLPGPLRKLPRVQGDGAPREPLREVQRGRRRRDAGRGRGQGGFSDDVRRGVSLFSFILKNVQLMRGGVDVRRSGRASVRWASTRGVRVGSLNAPNPPSPM